MAKRFLQRGCESTPIFPRRMAHAPVVKSFGFTPFRWVRCLPSAVWCRRCGKAFPQHRVLVSTTTDTGQELARKRFGEENVFYFPMDFAFAIRPYLQALQPELVVLAETEFWPNFLRLVHASGARIAVVNARISDRSWPRYHRFRWALRKMLAQVDLFLAQTQKDGDGSSRLERRKAGCRSRQSEVRYESACRPPSSRACAIPGERRCWSGAGLRQHRGGRGTAPAQGV